ncbi:MAG: Blue-light-activated protein [bacterium ADurb.Bin236]|nr:MAG: Blue-light-activated protein [bacterium ADurb.Bin236]HPN94081.1 PAS domain S-box protein [bacterium]
MKNRDQNSERPPIRLQSKIIAFVVALLFVSMAVFSYISLSSGLKMRERQARDEMARMASLIASAHTLSPQPDWERTDNYVKNVLTLYTKDEGPEILQLLYVIVFNEEGCPSAFAFNYELARKRGLEIPDIEHFSDAAENTSIDLIAPQSPLFGKISMPMTMNGKNWGRIETGYFVSRFIEEERANFARNMASLALLCMIGAIVAVFLARFTVRPILDVVSAMRGISRGDLDTRVRVSSLDEAMLLANGFNRMAAELKNFKLEIDDKTAKLLESEEKYRLLAESSSDFICLIGVDGVVKYVNASILKMINLPANAILGQRVSTISPEFSYRLIKDIFDCAVAKGEPIRREINIMEFTGMEWFDCVAVPVKSNGCVKSVLFVARDITDKKNAETELMKFKALVENSVDLIGMADIEGKLLFMNKNGKKLIGLNEDSDISDLSVFDIAVKEEHASIRNDIMPALISKGTWSGQAKIRNLKTGEIIEALITKFAVRNNEDGSDVCMATVIRDITDLISKQRENEMLQQQLFQSKKLEAIGTMTGGVAHDFNNMLAVIMGTCDVALAQHPDSPGADRFHKIKDVTKRAKELTMKLLTFSRKEKLNVRPVSADTLINDLVDILSRTIPISVKVKTDTQIPSPVVSVDSNQINQALLNVCINASDAMMGAGEILISCCVINIDVKELGAVEPVLPPGNYCRISITDSGHGMDEETLLKVFEPFFTTKEVGIGTGLGLYIAHGIITNHNGHIRVESRPGKGTTVTMLLPVAGAEEAFIADTFQPVYDNKSCSILLIDDNTDFLSMTSRLLRVSGCSVVTASSGAEGVDYFRMNHSELDVVILDMIMPEMDGSEVFEELKKIDPRAKIVICSGYSKDGAAAALLEKGAISFLQKPFDLQELKQILSQALNIAT